MGVPSAGNDKELRRSQVLQFDVGPSTVGVSDALLGSGEFERWYGRFGPQVFRYVARRLGPDTAEDITAQTFVEAWENRGRFDAELGGGRAWLFGIATNLIHRHRRDEQRQLRAYLRSGSELPVGPAADLSLDRVHAQAMSAAMSRALLRLRPVDRDLFWLHATTDLSYVELAAVTAMPVGTVRSRLSRTRAKLQAAVAGDEFDGGGR